MATTGKKPTTTKRTYRLSSSSARNGLIIKHLEENRQSAPFKQSLIWEISGKFTMGDVKKIVYDHVHNHIRYTSSKRTYPIVQIYDLKGNYLGHAVAEQDYFNDRWVEHDNVILRLISTNHGVYLFRLSPDGRLKEIRSWLTMGYEEWH